MIQKEFDTIRVRCAAATPGPWKEGYHGKILAGLYDSRVVAKVLEDNDAVFIAHAREDVPKLLAEIERLRGLLRFQEPLVTEDRAVKIMINGVKHKFPEALGVVDYVVECGTDWMGDKAVWIWAVVDDAAPKSRCWNEDTEAAAEVIRQEIRCCWKDRIPYVRFRTESEQREIDEEN